MPNAEKALSEILDVIEHLVSTHVRWNMNLSHAEAVAKVEAARVHLISTDISSVAADVENADPVSVVTDGAKTVTDAVNMVKGNE
jgi:ribose 5-phosphate isomerase